MTLSQLYNYAKGTKGCHAVTKQFQRGGSAAKKRTQNRVFLFSQSPWILHLGMNKDHTPGRRHRSDTASTSQ